VPYVLANPVKFNPFSSRFVGIPPDWGPEVAGDLPSRRGVRFGGGFGEIARVLTQLLFEDKMAPPRGDYEEQDRRAGKGTEVFVGGLPRSVTESTLREVGFGSSVSGLQFTTRWG